MIRFLFLGLIRDKHRSLLPIIVTVTGVFLAVVFHSWMTGILGGSIEYNAKFSTGHVKVMTNSYAENINQMPNDLALYETDKITRELKSMFPQMKWAERIHFAGLIDIPDETGETVEQGPAVGFGLDILTPGSEELDRMNIREALKSGKIPEKQGEVLLSNLFAEKLGVDVGDKLTLIGSTMYGEMAFYNFILSGTVEFGTTALDRGTIIADLQDVRMALNMENAAGEILGFIKNGYFDSEIVDPVVQEFNDEFHDPEDEFSPVMKSLKDMSSMGKLLDYSSQLLGILIFIFMLAMSIILWNAGLLGGIRRYGEFGMRLAIGEEKDHVYKTMIMESLIIGILGSIIGVAVGMLLAWYLQEYGLNFGKMMKNATIMMPSVFKAHITPQTWYIGFIPGVFSTLIGTMLSGIAIYKRQTAQLFKELQS